MAEFVVSVFSKTLFTDEEQLQATVFTELQERHIRNELAIAAEEKMGIALNSEVTNGREIFIMTHEYYRGKMEALAWLLSVHENNKDESMDAARAQIIDQANDIQSFDRDEL